MKKLFILITLLNFAPIIFNSDKDFNKKIACQVLTNASNLTVIVVRGTIKAVIPGFSLVCLAKHAWKTETVLEFDRIKDKLGWAFLKSTAAAVFLVTDPDMHDPKNRRCAIFFGAHALSAIIIPFINNFIDEKKLFLGSRGSSLSKNSSR